MSGMARGAVSLHGKHPFQCGRRNAQPPGNRNIIFYILVHSAAADNQEVIIQTASNDTGSTILTNILFIPATSVHIMLYLLLIIMVHS